MRTTVFALLACSPVLCAQTVVVSPAQATARGTSGVVLESPASGNCPVGFAASRVTDVAMRRTANPKDSETQKWSRSEPLALRLIFSPKADSTIAQARVILHGLSGAQVVPASQHEASESSESFAVSPSAGAHDRFSSVVYTEKLTGVTWVELKELAYANGTVWHESANATCRVAPNGYMLVGLNVGPK